jgi:diguanylate cyclase (GGDEF)-like protein
MTQRSSDETPPQTTQANAEQQPGSLIGSSLYAQTALEQDVLEHGQALQQVARLEALHALSLEVVAQHEPDQVIARALELAVRVLDAEASGYWQVLNQGYLLRALHGASDVSLGTRLPAGSGLTGRVVASGQSLLVEDYRHFEGRVPQFSDLWRSMMLAPVKRGESILGVLVISNNKRPGAFNGADLAILERLATVCAISLENARLLEAATRAEHESNLRAEQREAVRTLSLEVMAQREPDRVIARALETVMGLVGAQVGGFWRSHGIGRAIELLVTLGPTRTKPGMTMPWGTGAAGEVIATGRALRIEDYQTWAGRNPQFGSELNSVMLIPIKREQQVLGALIVARNGSPKDPDLQNPDLQNFDPADLELFEQFATPVALALDNARLLEVSRREELESRRRAEISGAINTLSFELTAALEPKAMFERILESATTLIGGDLGGVFLRNDTSELEVVTRFGEGWVTQPRIGFGATGRAVETGQSVLVEDYPSWEHRTPAPGLRWLSAISAPLRRAETVLGAITLADTHQTGRYSSLDLFGLERFAALASIALENTRLVATARQAEHASHHRAKLLEALHQTSLEVGAQLEPDVVLRLLVERIAELFAADSAAVYLVQNQTEANRNDASESRHLEPRHLEPKRFELRAAFGSSPSQDGFVGRGLTGQVIAGNHAQLIKDYQTWPGRDVRPNEPSVWRSAMSAPIRLSGSTIGALTIADTRSSDRFTPEDLETLERFAALASVTIENARLHNSERRVANEERLRNRIASAVASLRSVREFSTALLKELAMTFGYRFLSLYTLEASTNSGTLEASTNPGTLEASANPGTPSTTGVLHIQAQIGYKTPFTQIPLEFGINGRVARTGRAVLTNAQDPDFKIADDGMTSILCVPLRTGERVLGTLCIESKGEQLQYADLELITSLAESVSFALENARLYELERRRARDERLRFEISRAIARLSSQRALCEALVATLVEVLGYDHISVFRYDPDGLHLQAQHGYATPMQYLPVTHGVTGRVARSGRAAFVPEARLDPDYLSAESDLCAIISVPLLGRDGVLGVLNVESTDATRLEVADLEMLTSLTGPVAIALENARLYELEQRRARDERIRSSVSNALVRLRTVGELCRAVVSEVASSLAYTHVCIMQLEGHTAKQGDPKQAGLQQVGLQQAGLQQAGPKESERLRVRAQVGYRRLPEYLPLQGSFSGQVARSRQPTIVADTFEPGEYLRFDPELVYAIGVPLLGRDGVLGTLVVESAGTPKLTSLDLEMLVSLATPISVALENATLHESLEGRARELENLGREAHFAATHDTLTGLPNRRAFEIDAMHLLDQQRAKQHPFCLAVIDLVGFKAVNDNFGHAAGDEALKIIAQTLRILSSHQAMTSSLQSSSGDDVFAYRVGGDEFFLLIENDRSNAFKLVKQVISTVQGLEFGAGSELQVSPNIGLAEYPSDAPDLDNLLTLADTRMYAAKRAGKPVLEPDEFEHPPVPRRRKEDTEGQ